jgi:hypothetical protein
MHPPRASRQANRGWFQLQIVRQQPGTFVTSRRRDVRLTPDAIYPFPNTFSSVPILRFASDQHRTKSIPTFQITSVNTHQLLINPSAMSSSDNPQNPQNPQDPNRQQQPGLWAAHAEYIKGAAEVRFPSNPYTLPSLLPLKFPHPLFPPSRHPPKPSIHSRLTPENRARSAA